MLAALNIILMSTFTLIECLKKWGLLDRYEAYRYKWMPEGGCGICIGFWLSIVVALLYAFASWLQIEWVFIPFACAGIINYLIKTGQK